MFCDLAGSTALSARLDPEDMREIIGAYHHCCAEQITKAGGFVAKYMGDGVLAYFGYPEAHEDDAERAVRAGLGVIDAVPTLPAAHDGTLKVRIGIATGLVVVGDLVGEGASQEAGVVGETPNVAARLQALAEPGQMVISDGTRRLTGGMFEYGDLGSAVLKGIVGPVQAWRVIGASEVQSRFEAQHEANLTPLVDREEELELVLRRWRHAVSREGRVVLLSGEAGIGKSRLIVALQERLQAEPHTRLRYFCSPHHSDSAFYPTIARLERAAGFERRDTAVAKFDKLTSLLASSSVLEGDIQLLAELLSIPPSERYAPLDLSPQRKKERTIEALLRQLESLSRKQPVFMIYEDVQWIDPSSRELLDMVVERVARLPVLLVLTYRPDFQPPWTGQAHVTTLSLTRLGRREVAAIVGSVAGSKLLPDEIMEKIAERADGIPLFVEELTKAVLDAGVRVDDTGKAPSTMPYAALVVPATLHASFMARLDHLGPVAKETAQIGAAIGREFSYELLAPVAQRSEPELQAALTRLTDAGLISCRGMPPQARFLFKHALVRDAAYSSLLRRQRQHLHARIFSTLEGQFRDMAEVQPELLAQHCAEAGLVEMAVGYWLRAGRRAAERSANLEAIAHLRRGIEAVGHFRDGSEKDRIELDLHLALGPCLIATQGPETAMVAFLRARELCQRLANPPEYLRVMHWLMIVRAVRGELPQALEAVTTLVGLAAARDDRPAVLNAIRAEGLIRLVMGRVADAYELTERAMEQFNESDEAGKLATRAAGQDAGAAGLAVVAWALWVLGQVDTAAIRMAAALQRAEAINHPQTQAYACYYASVLYALRGEFEIARAHAERCFSLAEQHGFRQWHSLSRVVRSICTIALDASSTAMFDATSGLDEHLGAGYQFGVTALYALLAQALLLRRQPDAALDVIERGLSTVKATSERLFEAELQRLQARALLERGRPELGAEVQALLNTALIIAREQQARLIELRASHDLAAIWREQGKRNEARDLLAPVYGRFTEGFDTPDLKEAKALLAELAQ
jgi:predicted ATPase/class 3 adenylate cyclase